MSSIEMCNSFTCSCAPGTVSLHSVLHMDSQIPSYIKSRPSSTSSNIFSFSRIFFFLCSCLGRDEDQLHCRIQMNKIFVLWSSWLFLAVTTHAHSLVALIIVLLSVWKELLILKYICLSDVRRAVPAWVWKTLANSQFLTNFVCLIYVSIRQSAESYGTLFLYLFINTRNK